LDLLNDRMQVDDDPSAAMESVPLSYTCKFNRLNVERVIDYRVSISAFLGITCSAAAATPLTLWSYWPASSQRNALNYKGHGIFWGLGLEPHLVKKTGNPRTAQRQLGHKNPSTTMQYLQFTRKEMQEALDDR
jgi:hypothetical protein